MYPSTKILVHIFKYVSFCISTGLVPVEGCCYGNVIYSGQQIHCPCTYCVRSALYCVSVVFCCAGLSECGVDVTWPLNVTFRQVKNQTEPTQTATLAESMLHLIRRNPHWGIRCVCVRVCECRDVQMSVGDVLKGDWGMQACVCMWFVSVFSLGCF